jgi:hypothetical protein
LADSRRTHECRYVLKNKKTDEVFFVVLFTLKRKEDVAAGEGKVHEPNGDSKEEDGNKESNGGDDEVD